MNNKEAQEVLSPSRYYFGLISSWVLLLCWIAAVYYVWFIWDVSAVYRIPVGIFLALGARELRQLHVLCRSYSRFLKDF